MSKQKSVNASTPASGSVRPTLHIYTAGNQPAHNFVDHNGGGRPMRFRCSPLALKTCDICWKRRRAKNLQVQVFYDMIRYSCKDKSQCTKRKH